MCLEHQHFPSTIWDKRRAAKVKLWKVSAWNYWHPVLFSTLGLQCGTIEYVITLFLGFFCFFFFKVRTQRGTTNLVRYWKLTLSVRAGLVVGSVYIEQELSHRISSYGYNCPSLPAKSLKTSPIFLVYPSSSVRWLCWKSLVSPCLNKVLLHRQE